MPTRRTTTSAGLLAALLLSACGQGAVQQAGGTVELASPDTVVRDGDRVTGASRIVQLPGQPARFCGSEFTTDVGYAPGEEPAPYDCPNGVPLEGVDLDRLADRRRSGGAVEGWATITGTWRAGTITVEEQDDPPPLGEFGLRQEPPCPAPEGGWPHGPERDSMDAELQALKGYWAEHPSDPDRFAQLHVSPTQTLFGLVVSDEAAKAQAELDLRPLLGDRMCVVVARHTDAELAAVRDSDLVRRPESRGGGMHLGEDLQAALQLSVLFVTEELAAAVAEHPEGLVELEPALRVVRQQDRLEPAPAPTAEPDQPTPDAEPTADPSPTTDPRIPTEGSRVTATGRLQQVDGRPAQLCSQNQIFPAIPRGPDYVPPPCLGVDVEGLDTDRLSDGSATVVGTLRGGAIVVEEQTAPVEQPSSRGLPDVPCPTPAGGWPDGGAPYDDRSPDDAALGAFSEANPQLSGRILLLRPAADRQVATVVVRDDAERMQVERALGPSFAGRLCVVVSTEDVDLATRAQNDLRFAETDGLISAGTQFGGADFRDVLYVEALQFTQDLLDLQADYPPGLVEVRPFLAVVED